MAKSPITCHVLDAAVGRPAAGVPVALSLIGSSGSTTVSVKELAAGTLLDPAAQLEPGVYRMTFQTGAYFAATGTKSFYPFVEITFNYENPAQHYHIPLLLSPFSYTTYRGS